MKKYIQKYKYINKKICAYDLKFTDKVKTIYGTYAELEYMQFNKTTNTINIVAVDPKGRISKDSYTVTDIIEIVRPEEAI